MGEEMPRRFRKCRKLRGSRTHGWGIQAQHRRKGKGGRGKAGIHTYKWAPPTPKYLGKRGFMSVEKLGEVTTINVGELDELVATLAPKDLTKEEGKERINLSELGYDKLLGRGKISKPMIVAARFVSKLAKRKVEEIGGRVVKIN